MLFREWVKNIYPVLAHADISDNVIAIDGKASRHTFDENNNSLKQLIELCFTLKYYTRCFFLFNN